jgi:hypothetical protein
MQILTWSSFGVDQFGGNPGGPKTQTAIYDPVTNAASKVATVTVTKHDMFCPGITMLGSGDIVVTGGNNAEKTSIYDVKKHVWRAGPDMIRPRGYQASALLSTGEVCFDTTHCAGHALRGAFLDMRPAGATRRPVSTWRCCRQKALRAIWCLVAHGGAPKVVIAVLSCMFFSRRSTHSRLPVVPVL